MNERIKLLAEEAGLMTIIHQWSWEFGNCDTSKDSYPLEKFVELMVQECVIRCEREWIRHGADSVHNQAVSGCINSIKQHFGVEE